MFELGERVILILRIPVRFFLTYLTQFGDLQNMYKKRELFL